jgi:hypothetical protein
LSNETKTTPGPTEIIPVELIPLDAPDRLARALRIFEKITRDALRPCDFATIQGKRHVKKSGCSLLAQVCGVSTEKRDEEREDRPNGERLYHFTYRAIAPNGRFMDAVGSGSTKEKQFTHVDHDARTLGQTRAYNRCILNLVAAGEVSAEEIVGDVPVEVESQQPESKEGGTIVPPDVPQSIPVSPEPTTATQTPPKTETSLNAPAPYTASIPPTPTSASQPEPNSIASVSEEQLMAKLIASVSEEQLMAKLDSLEWVDQHGKHGGTCTYWEPIPQPYKGKTAQKGPKFRLGGYYYERWTGSDGKERLSRYAVKASSPSPSQTRDGTPTEISEQKPTENSVAGTTALPETTTHIWKVPVANDLLSNDAKPPGLRQLLLYRKLKQYGCLNQLGNEISIVPTQSVNPDNGYWYWFIHGSAAKSGIIEPICEKYKLHYKLEYDEKKLVRAIMIAGDSGELDYKHTQGLADAAARAFQLLLEENAEKGGSTQ